jgi:peptide-methionine (S)-S-oxide reductase
MSSKTELATLGGGCFWCLEAIYQDVIGVSKVTSGYAGGAVENPSYEQVCSGRTGHAEVVQIEFDPEIISYDDLLTIFWRIHDPTTLNRQGADVGTQYRSIILTHDEAQKAAADRSLSAIQAAKLYRDPIVTEIVSLDTFYPAEGYHDDYYNRNRNQPYCRAVIDPKVRKFRKSFADKLKQPA